MTSPMRIRALGDGRAGIDAQALGLAEAVARRRPGADVTLHRVRLPEPWRRLPADWAPKSLARLAPELAAAFAAPDGPPALIVGCGRAAAAVAMAARRARPAPFVVQLQHPRTPLSRFDLVVPPRHDGLEGANVFPILGAPNRIAADRLAGAAAALRRATPALAGEGGPVVAATIGGSNRGFTLDAAAAARIAGDLAALVADGARLTVSLSRRTPPEAARLLAARLTPVAALFYDPATAPPARENPYFGMLGLADLVVTTADSVNMATEAATAGKPLLVIDLPRRGRGGAKFDRLHADLRSMGLSRPFAGRVEVWRPPPFDETGRAAEEVLRRMAAG